MVRSGVCQREAVSWVKIFRLWSKGYRVGHNKNQMRIGNVLFSGVLTVCLLLVISPVASQQAPGPAFSPEEMFERLDTDRDGKVTQNEVPEREQGFIERFDHDGDGVVTRDEIVDAVKEAITRQSARDASTQRQRGPRANFERTAPKVGEALPDASGYDAEGKEFKLSRLKGSYSVLVFGCLT